MKDYNGWKNRSTWNVALWIANSYELYTQAVEFVKNYSGKNPYKDYIKYIGRENEKTLDNIKWLSSRLDYQELNAFMIRLVK